MKAPASSSRGSGQSAALLFIFPPHVAVELYGFGPGGRRALLATLKRGATGLVSAPMQAGWFYTLDYHHQDDSVVNTPEGQKLSILHHTPYKVYGWQAFKRHHMVQSGNSGASGQVTLPHGSQEYLAVSYHEGHSKMSVNIYEP
jgi:hypothetical protein